MEIEKRELLFLKFQLLMFLASIVALYYNWSVCRLVGSLKQGQAEYIIMIQDMYLILCMKLYTHNDLLELIYISYHAYNFVHRILCIEFNVCNQNYASRFVYKMQNTNN